MLNSSSGLLQSDPFDIVSDIGLTVSLLGVSISYTTSLPETTGSGSTSIDIVASLDRPSKRNDNMSTPCLP